MKKWFSLEGRATRKEWWIVVLITVLISFVIGFTVPFLLVGLIFATFTPSSSFGAVSLLVFVAIIGVAFVSLAAYYAASVRRYHDRAKSGWWVLVALIPVVGAVWQLVELGFTESVNENNPYGANTAATEQKSVDRLTVGDLAAQPVAQ